MIPLLLHRAGALAGAVTVAPTLTLTSVDADSVDFTVDEIGTAYWMVDSNASRTGAQIEAGGGDASDSFAVGTGANSEPIDLSAVAAGNYKFHIVVKDGDGNYSNVVTEDLTIGYTQNVVVSDGTFRLAKAGASFSDSAVGLFSAWFSVDTDGVDHILFDNGRCSLNRISSNKLRLQLRDAANTTYFVNDGSVSFTAATAFAHVLIAWDYSGASGSNSHRIYLNDTQMVNVTNDIDAGNLSWGATTLELFDATFDGNVADLYLNIAETLDITVEANRRKFIDASGNPVDLGANAVTPTGNQPAVCFSGNAAHWNAGNGIGSVTGWTVTSTVADV